MKTSLTSTKVWSIHTFLFLFFHMVSPTEAYILPLDFIVKKTVATPLRPLVVIDQEVIFKSDKETLKTSEQWIIEGDRNLKLSAKGLDTIKDQFIYNSLYSAKTITQIKGKDKNQRPLTSDFYQKILFIKSPEVFNEFLSAQSIQDSVRLSRTDGWVTFAIGEKSESQATFPQVWIDQDYFFIRKLRLKSGAVIKFSDFTKIDNSNWIAKTQEITWDKFVVTIKIKNINTKSNYNLQTFAQSQFDQPTQISFKSKSELVPLVKLFYLRFR